MFEKIRSRAAEILQIKQYESLAGVLDSGDKVLMCHLHWDDPIRNRGKSRRRQSQSGIF